MPTYAYRCPDCGREFDVFQRITDPPGADCPGCGGRAQRVITGGGGLLFKGGGFHQTDYRSESYRKAAKSESGEAGKTEGGVAKQAGGAAKEAGGTARDAGRAAPGDAAKPGAKEAPKGGDA